MGADDVEQAFLNHVESPGLAPAAGEARSDGSGEDWPRRLQQAGESVRVAGASGDETGVESSSLWTPIGRLRGCGVLPCRRIIPLGGGIPLEPPHRDSASRQAELCGDSRSVTGVSPAPSGLLPRELTGRRNPLRDNGFRRSLHLGCRFPLPNPPPRGEGFPPAQQAPRRHAALPACPSLPSVARS